MKKMFIAINCLVAAVITTLLILTVSFMLMLFSSAQTGHRTSYFGSLFFSSTPAIDGSLGLNFGVANTAPILITAVLLFVIYLLLFLFYKRFKSR